VNKKKQKNFDSLQHLARTAPNPAGAKVFCFFFSKKKPYFRRQPASGL
jgi:hypothetical protein